MPRHRHFIIHKPYGMLSQFTNNDHAKNKKKLLGELHDFPNNTMAIGRLDEKSEGLLLLTTDGMTSELIRSKKVQKEYYVQVDGDITEEAIFQLQTGVEIGINGKKYFTLPCTCKKLSPIPLFPKRTKKIRDDRHGPTSWISITITEGKFRQVRKMTASVGFATLRLIRVRIGKINLNSLQAGEVQETEELKF